MTDSEHQRSGHESDPKVPSAGEVERLKSRLAEVKRELVVLRDRLHLVGQAARIGLWEYDFESEVLHVSDELAALYGLSPEEFTWAEFVARLHPGDLIDELERPTPSYPFGRPNEYFLRVRHRDGSYRTIRSRSVTHGPGERPLRKLGVHIDITDDELLSLLNDKLVEKNRRLRQFAYSASHDLRSPLRAIRTLLTMTVDDQDTELPDGVRDRLAMADGRAVDLQRLLDDLLTFATTDLETREPRLLDPDRVVTEAAAAVDPHGCRLIIEPGGGGSRWLVDAPLALCVRSLIDNACTHHHKSDGTVTVSVTDEGPGLRIEVSDDGPGIPAAQQERIFEPFVSFDTSRSTGLGLANVQELVDRNGGSLGLASQPGQGSTFTLRWPVDALESFGDALPEGDAGS